MFRGRFIQGSHGFRGGREAARVEARVFAFFGFALALGVPDASSSWPPALAVLIAIPALACAAPFGWYAAWSVITFLGVASSEAPASARDYRRRCIGCRKQSRLAAARVERIIMRVEAYWFDAAAAGGRAAQRRSSEVVEAEALDYYANHCEAWVVAILREAWRLEANVPDSIQSRIAAGSLDDLRVLVDLLRELEDELGELASIDQ